MISFNEAYQQIVNKKFNIDNDLDIRTLKSPAFLMNAPFSLSAANPNNIWMKELPKKERKIDVNKSFNEWMDLYTYLSSMSLVYILPSIPNLQDQTYVANLGIVLPHKKK